MSDKSKRSKPSKKGKMPTSGRASTVEKPGSEKAPRSAVDSKADAWTKKVPRPVHWLLTVLTFGVWAIVWKQPARLWVASTLSGFLLFLSFADWDIWPFGFIFVVPMLYVAEQCETKKQAFWWSLWTGLVSNFGGFYWISGLLMDFGQMHWSVAIAICLVMNLYQGLSFAFFGTLFHIVRKGLALPAVLLAPVIWTTVELVTPLIFPYYLGNSQYTFPAMIQIAELLGPLAVGTILFIANGAIYDLLLSFVVEKKKTTAALRKRALVSGGIAAAVVAANIIFGFVRMGQIDALEAAAPKLKIGMAEADIGIWSKENPEKMSNNLIIHQGLSKTLSEQDKVDLIVWPESSFQSPSVFASREKTKDLAELESSVREYRRFIPHDATYIRPSKAALLPTDADDIRQKTSRQDRFGIQRDFQTPLLFGGITFRVLSPQEMAEKPPNKKTWKIVDGKKVRVPRDYRVYNTAVLLDAKGRLIGTYNKTFLLAFGETIPFADYIPWVYDMIPAASEFTPGNTIEVFEFGEHRLGVMICYEDIIPAFGRKLARENPDVLINVTNDAWFGKTAEPYLHLALATFRSVETRKWLLRSTNTGVSAFIDASGRIRAQTSIYDPETLSQEVPMMKGGPTVYVIIGDVIGYIALAGLLALLVMVRRRKRTREEAPEPQA